MHFKLSKTARISKINNEKTIVAVGSGQFICDEQESEQILKLCAYLKNEKTKDELDDFIVKNNINFDVIQKLICSNIISTNPAVFESRDSPEFKNQLYLDVLYNQDSKKIQDEIASYNFIIIGAGGIGNCMAYSLAFYAPKKLIFIDGDKIELSNLNRQFLFDKDGVGAYKAQTLKTGLIKKGATCLIEAINEYASEKTLNSVLKALYGQKSLMIISADSDDILKVATKAAFQYEIPYLNIGYLNDISVICPFFIPHVSSCVFCNNAFFVEEQEALHDEMLAYMNAHSSAPSAFVNNSLASSMALIDIFTYLSGDLNSISSLNKRLGICNKNFNKLEILNLKDKNCKYCQGK